ncbi:MAG: hypothetical protein ABWY06_23095 [Pseudomonas sp.]|uniref:hypothetical protein n=1 Tax=Pseudomonas sp. TaxID=306 RepID=UPI003390C1DE
MLNFFQKKNLASACTTLVSLTALLASAPAQAVNLSSNGQGQVLIYPYYTVRGGHDSYLSVVNRTDQAKVVQVRLREARNGREVLAVKVFLAAHDQWSAGVTATADGAKLFTGDPSCTSPAIPAGGAPLSNARFASTTITPGLMSTGGDGAGTELDRTREGYIEVIELGVLSHAATLATLGGERGSAACSPALLSADMGPQAGARSLSSPSGGLLGSGTLINVAGGTEYSYQPVVLDGFSNVNLWTVEGPDLRAATPKISLTLNKGRAITSTWSKGEDAVSAVLTHASLSNDYVLERSTQSGTDWVVTMPTKHYYVPVIDDVPIMPLQPFKPFASGFNGQACNWVHDTDRLNPWDREGREAGGGDVDFATRPPYNPLYCWESSVVSFGTSVLGSLARTENTGDVGWHPEQMNGWGEQRFREPHQQLTSLEGHVYRGLPVTGFMVHNFANGNVGGLLSNYGGNFDHKYTTVVETP